MTIFNKHEGQSEININDEIGFWGITHQDFTNQLSELDGGDLTLNIASYGGDVSHAFSIYNSLKSYSGRIIANVYGDSASAATFIAMAADEIRIVDNALFLIHNVWGGVVGDSEELRKQADLMDKMNNNIINVYKKKTGLAKAAIKDLMNNEEWWTAKEAQKHGFVDTVVAPKDIVRNEAVLMNCANEEMKQALLEKVNKLNTNKNQVKMAEEKDASKVDALIEKMGNFFSNKVEVVEEEKVEVVVDTFSEEDVNTIVNKAEEVANKIKDEAKVKADADALVIANLTAELEKANAVATEAKAEDKAPEDDAKKVENSDSPFIVKTLDRLANKYKGILKFK
jgi:ATP-dependent protease ClpP protease subunit